MSRQGNGECVCTGPFTGSECDKCIHGWTGPYCNISMYCHGNSHCSDGLQGNGECVCVPDLSLD